MENDDFSQLVKDLIGKWSLSSKGVIPMWLADQDFLLPFFLRKKLIHHIQNMSGSYPCGNTEPLKNIIANFLTMEYNTPRICQNNVILVRGLNGAYQKIIIELTDKDDEILLLTPEYSAIARHILKLKRRPSYINFNMKLQNKRIHYQLDFDLLTKKITPKTKMLIFSSPHNPTGHIFTKAELLKIAEICLTNNIFLVTAEIWSGLIMHHTPFYSIANLGEKVWDKLILLNSISKTFNTSDFMSGYIVVKNPELYHLLNESITSSNEFRPSELSYMVTQWCMEYGKNYQQNLINYLRINREFLLDFFSEQLPYIQCTDIPATYMAWLNLSALKLNNPAQFLLENAQVHLSSGHHYGPGQAQFARLLFACPRSLLETALWRIKKACDSVYQ